MRKCAYCGESFEPRRSDQIYCSHVHRTYASRQRQRARKDKLIEVQGLLKRMEAFAPKTVATFDRFIQQYGADCAEAAIRLCLTAYTEARPIVANVRVL